MALTNSAEAIPTSQRSRWRARLGDDVILLGTIFGVISALAYTGTNLTLRNVAGTHSVDWAIWVSCWKGVPAALIAWLLILRESRRGRPGLPPKRLFLPLISTGLFMQFVGNVGFQWGLSLGGLTLTVPLTFATLIGSGAILGRIVLGEPITIRSLIAIGVLVAAVAVLSLGAEDATRSTISESSWLVILGAIISASLAGLAYGTCGVVIRRTTTGHKVSLPATLVLLSTTGVVGLGITSWLRMGSSGLLKTTPGELANMLGAGVLNAIAFFACGAALQRLSVTRVNLINASQAAMCAAGGVVFFNEALTIWIVLGTCCTIGGLMLMERPASPSDTDDSKKDPPIAAHRILAETLIETCEIHEELASTNDRGLELASQTDLITPAVIIARHQTTGRGRGENRWWSAEGALTFSLVLDAERSTRSAENWPQVALAAGLAVSEAVEPLLTRGRLKLKWPNDVMLANKKLCGILCEMPASSKARIVVGIGINVNNTFQNAPAEVQSRATSIREATGQTQELESVLIAVLQQFEMQLAGLAENSSDFARRFRERCWLNGREISVHTGGKTARGICQSIDENGALLLETSEGPRSIVSGTVNVLDH